VGRRICFVFLFEGKLSHPHFQEKVIFFIALPDEVWHRQCVPESGGSGSETLPSTRVNRMEWNGMRWTDCDQIPSSLIMYERIVEQCTRSEMELA
jgi:hypothetical protein